MFDPYRRQAWLDPRAL